MTYIEHGHFQLRPDTLWQRTGDYFQLNDGEIVRQLQFADLCGTLFVPLELGLVVSEAMVLSWSLCSNGLCHLSLLWS